MNSKLKHKNKLSLEKALKILYPAKEVVKCPMCSRKFRGCNMEHHLIAMHGGNAVKRGTLSKKKRQEARKSHIHTIKENPKKTSKQQRARDENAKGKPVLTDGHTPGSNLRKIDK